MMNWERLIDLLLPCSLREALLLKALLSALTHYTQNRYNSEEAYKDLWIERMKYVSQEQLLLKVLNDKLDPTQRRITFAAEMEEALMVVGQEDQVKCFGEEEEIRIVRVEEEIPEQHSLEVRVPESVAESAVREIMDRYVFYGVNYTVVRIS